MEFEIGYSILEMLAKVIEICEGIIHMSKQTWDHVSQGK